MPRFVSFADAVAYSHGSLAMDGQDVDPGRWQGVPTEGKPDLVTKELMNHTFEVPMWRKEWEEKSEDWVDRITDEINPNLPWADVHFAERVGGLPLNPDPSYQQWPWWQGQESSKTAGGQFTHTYSERFWPKHADGSVGGRNWDEGEHNMGVRYELGDYKDLLDLLFREPNTRQAYLPIFFPEDTGAVHAGRIPCTLGYHFLRRFGKLHCWYTIRSCDAVRHFQDDLYLAVRLCGHTLNELLERELRSDRKQVWVDTVPGTLFFTAYSFHMHKGDLHHAPKP